MPFDMKECGSAMKQGSEEKGISAESVFETIEAAIAAAYKREYGEKGQIIKAAMNPETGVLEMTQTHYVVEGVDEDGNITGPLPVKVVEEKPDFQDMEGGRRRGATEEKVIEDGEVKIKFNPQKHILLADAKKQKKSIEVGDEIITKLEPKTDFGRIAAQVAKQVIIQRLREAERSAIFTEFKNREGEIVSGTVQRREGALVFVDLG